MGIGLNWAAAALVGAIFAAGGEPGGLGARWSAWLLAGGIATGIGAVAFRFPRSVALPLALAVAAGIWLVAGAVQDFHPPGPAKRVQPLSDRETVTVFALRVDQLKVPVALPGLPTVFYRFRPGDGEPSEWWWSWAVSRGWAQSRGSVLPEHPLKYAVYRLEGEGQEPRWTLDRPELTVPESDPEEGPTP